MGTMSQPLSCARPVCSCFSKLAKIPSLHYLELEFENMVRLRVDKEEREKIKLQGEK